jgi:hypothetical protein
MRRSSALRPPRPPISFAIKALSRPSAGRAPTPITRTPVSRCRPAVLAHDIAESQAFIDANKRLALVAMLTFLELNGYGVEAADPDLAEWILSHSAGTSGALPRASASADRGAAEVRRSSLHLRSTPASIAST